MTFGRALLVVTLFCAACTQGAPPHSPEYNDALDAYDVAIKVAGDDFGDPIFDDALARLRVVTPDALDEYAEAQRLAAAILKHRNKARVVAEVEAARAEATAKRMAEEERDAQVQWRRQDLSEQRRLQAEERQRVLRERQQNRELRRRSSAEQRRQARENAKRRYEEQRAKSEVSRLRIQSEYEAGKREAEAAQAAAVESAAARKASCAKVYEECRTGCWTKHRAGGPDMTACMTGCRSASQRCR